MPTTRTPAYRRLPGSGSNFVSSSRLYLGEDHLLLVTSNGFTETYRRIAFRDVQTLTLRHTRLGQVINLVWGGLAVLFTAFALGLGGGSGAVVPWSLTAVWLFFLTLNTIAGPTCASCLQTAARTHPLPSLSRVHRARKVFHQLAPLVVQAQGELSPAAPGEPAETQIAAPPVMAPPAPTTPAPPGSSTSPG